MIKERDNPFRLDVVPIRLVKDSPIYSDKPMNTAVAVTEALGKELCEMDREVMCVSHLKTNGVPINCSYVSMVSLNSSLLEPREVFKSSILSNAAGIVLLHNHPSGSLEPSLSDLQLTAKLAVAGDYIGIKVLDHIIVGGDNSKYFSFAENNIMPSVKYKEHREKEEKLTMVAEQGRSR